MAAIWKSRSRKPIAMGEPSCSFAPGNRNVPDEYNFNLINEKGENIYIQLTEFELRKMIQIGKGLQKERMTTHL